MTKQVEKKHYDFQKYAHKERWVSYFHQLDELLKLDPKKILEIGVGDRVFGGYIKNNVDIEYISLDIAEDLQPNIVGSITSIPLEDGSVDAVCAFEVLEHLPYEDFDKALLEISRVSKKYVLISLPHFSPRFQFFLKLPLVPEIRFSFKLPWPKSHEFNGEHYWEIGKRGYPLRRILQSMERYFVIERHFVPFENQYHHFFVLRKK